MSLLTDLTTYIAANSTIVTAFGTTITAGTNLFVTFEPNTPNSCITLYPYGGEPPDTTPKTRRVSNIQVRVRAASFQVSYNTCQAIINQLHFNGNVLTGADGMVYALQSQPIFLTRDTENRDICVCNFRILHFQY